MGSLFLMKRFCKVELALTLAVGPMLFFGLATAGASGTKETTKPGEVRRGQLDFQREPRGHQPRQADFDLRGRQP
jgi:hypothetical protein